MKRYFDGLPWITRHWPAETFVLILAGGIIGVVGTFIGIWLWTS